MHIKLNQINDEIGMSIQCVVGLYLDACRFSKSSYELEFSGMIGDKNYSYKIGSPYYLSSSSKEKDAQEKVSSLLWPLLEKKLISVIEDNENLHVRFEFENSEGFIIWSDQPLIDNLMIVKNTINGTWFSVL